MLRDGGVQFVVFSRSATAMRVLLYDTVNDLDPSRIDRIQPRLPTAGATSGACSCPDLKAGQLYHFQADGPFDPERGPPLRSAMRG